MPSPIITKYKGDYPTCIGVEYALVPKGLNPSLGVDSFGFSALGSNSNVKSLKSWNHESQHQKKELKILYIQDSKYRKINL